MRTFPFTSPFNAAELPRAIIPRHSGIQIVSGSQKDS
jgi:hypothetical protein